MDHVEVLKGVLELPFPVGKKLLIDILRGDDSNESVQRNKLDKLNCFGSLAYTKEELDELIEKLLTSGYLRYGTVSGKKFWKVLEITEKGESEIENPTEAETRKAPKTVISEADKKVFSALGPALEGLNDRQKKAVIASDDRVLCIAGAGTGKTTVLTRRIEFLVRYCGVDPSKVLAITFTRKARAEMVKRLSSLPGVFVETFNSFCENILRKHSDIVYGREMRVINFRDKFFIVQRALEKEGMNLAKAVSVYFDGQKKGKSDEQLASIFVSDCFFIRDYFKFKGRELKLEGNRTAKLVFSVVSFIDQFMEENGLRDFADQLLDTIKLFSEREDLVPRFEHVLVDEYQDVNDTQVELLELLGAPKLFAVGDPRQSIYGWRGSDVNYVLDFSGAQVVTLTENYRSERSIVELCNLAIKHMGLEDLQPTRNSKKDITIDKCSSEEQEMDLVINRILEANCARDEIFVLARTNRQLSELSRKLKAKNIKHVVRTEDSRNMVIALEGEVTLATVHAIKGMEASKVFVIGCNGANFPCKGSEHPIIEKVKVDEYDKYEEERRLFYVALSRARDSLHISYSGKKPTPFLSSEMIEMVKGVADIPIGDKHSTKLFDRLKKWRKEKAEEEGMPAYIIAHDSTLINIVQAMPFDEEELARVNGMGPTKVRKYGEEILDIVGGK